MGAEKSIGTSLTKTSGASLIVAGLTSIGEIGGEASEIEVTSLDSPFGYKEFIASLKDGGEVPLSGFVKDAQDLEDLMALFESQTNESWEVEFVSGSKWFFVGFVKMCKEAETTVEGARGFSASIRVSGKPVYADDGISV